MLNDIQEITGHQIAAHMGHSASAGRDGAIMPSDTTSSAPHPANLPAASPRAPERAKPGPLQEMVGEGIRRDPFSAPLIAEILEVWRLRNDMVRGQSKLSLQAQAVCRRYTGGDKDEASKVWAAIRGGKGHPLADMAALAVMQYVAASGPFEKQRAEYEKHLARLAKGLPIAHVVATIKGVNHNTLAAIVGELGDLSVYEKGIAGIWKRAGLAVINGERQRKKSNAEEALAHGYSPTRRSVFWNVGTALLKAQGTGEASGPYRLVYDDAKAKALAKEMTKAHAHNHACRVMTKRLLKDLWIEWRRVSV